MANYVIITDITTGGDTTITTKRAKSLEKAQTLFEEAKANAHYYIKLYNMYIMEDTAFDFEGRSETDMYCETHISVYIEEE